MPCPPGFSAWLEHQVVVEHPESAYHFGAEIFHEIGDRIEAAPGLITPECIGTSLEGRPIWAFHIQDPAVEPVGSMLVFANIHALEWISSEAALGFFKEATTFPYQPARITVIPVLNPDGRFRVEQDVRAGKNVYRRGNAEHVDLNRDFAIHREVQAVWARFLPGYYSTSPQALSQPETQALDALAGRELYDASVSLHAFGGFLYYPWSGRFARNPDWKQFHALGVQMQAEQGAHAYRPRQLSRWGFFFRAQGSDLDHFYGKYGTFSFLIELTRSGVVVGDPKTWKTYFRWYNPIDPSYHTAQGVAALRALLRAVVRGDARRREPPVGLTSETP